MTLDTEISDRKELLKQILAERKLFEETLAKVDQTEYLKPIFDGGWTIKDVLAHIVAWEQRMIIWVGQAASGVFPDIPLDDDSVNAINQESHNQDKDLPLDQVLQAFERSYTKALNFAENTSEEVLFTKNLLEGRENPYWITVAANTCWHYQEHREALEQYLSRQSGK